jgi:ketosteroid isomerase-like protein
MNKDLILKMFTVAMNKDLILKMFMSIDAGRWSELPNYFAEDVVYERPGYEPVEGILGLLDFYQNRRIIANGIHHLDRIVSDEVAAAAWGRFSGTSRTGEPLGARFADTYMLEGEKIRRRTTFFYRAAL